MKYRVRTDVCFNNQGSALGLFNHIKAQFNQIVNLGEDEISFAKLEECHHDETPGKPCVVIEYIEKE